MGLFSTYEPMNPGEIATRQMDMNRSAARDTRRFSDIDQENPWGRVTHPGVIGRPGAYKRKVQLHPQDQLELDQFRTNRGFLSGLISDYMNPQIEQAAGMRFNYGALPNVPQTQNFAQGAAPRFVQNMAQANQGYQQPMQQTQAPQQAPSFVSGPTQAMQDYRSAMQDWRGNELERLEKMYNATPTLPEHISKQDIINYFSEFNKEKSSDVDRWLNEHGLTDVDPDTAGDQYRIADINKYALENFSGASDRSRELLQDLPRWITDIYQPQHAIQPEDLPRTPIPDRPDLDTLIGRYY